jgi:hypothetical protein
LALFADFALLFSIEDWRWGTCYADVSDLWWVRWFWDLICDFWAENAEEKHKGTNNSRSPSGMTTREATVKARA